MNNKEQKVETSTEAAIDGNTLLAADLLSQIKIKMRSYRYGYCCRFGLPITDWRLAFVADFGIQNFNLKINLI